MQFDVAPHYLAFFYFVQSW